MTTLGMGLEEMNEVADIIHSVLSHAKPATVQKTGQPSRAQAIADPFILDAARRRVDQLLSRFPLYPEIPI